MLNMNSDFVITGVWGSSEDLLKVQGTLTFETGKAVLVTTERLSLGKTSTPSVFGIGHVKSEGTRQDDIIMITLIGVAETTSGKTTKQLPHSLTAEFNHFEYVALSMFTGDTFISTNATLKTVKVYPTNFSAWMHNPQDFDQSERDSNKLTVSAKDSSGYTIESKDGGTVYAFRRSLISTEVERLSQIDRVIQITDFFQMDNKDGMSLQYSMALVQKVSSWYHLLTNKPESVYRTNFITLDDESVDFFNLTRSMSVKQDDYLHESAFLVRARQWKENMLKSLVDWIDNYEVFAPLEVAIYPPETLSIEFRLQTECVAIETIIDNFYPKIKKGYYKKKVSYFMNQIDDFVTVDALKLFPVKEDIESLSTKVKQYRNPLSHNYQKAGIKPLEEKILLFNVLKAMIRNWLLNKIQIDKPTIKADFQMFSSIKGYIIKGV